ncbi:MAG: TonB C-terminal domain-containing protein [Deltaproteobacteria bacterium]|jgi:outer membrane biosynthesis protein TonB|nr:TonB C-terminal domain-containing protein [Deltaproteobacteria bacterium]
MQSSRYFPPARAAERFGLVLAISLSVHILALTGLVIAPSLFDFGRSPELPFEAITVQLMGSLDIPAPAAPPAPVDPNLNLPDVVELPSAEPILPQPTPLDQMITPPVPNEVIPIAERPPDTPPPAVKSPEPPPRVQIPEKPPEKPPEVKKPVRSNPVRTTDSTVEELRRKQAAEQAEREMQSRVANLARERGRGDGTSAANQSGSSAGQQIDPLKAQYYNQVKEIIRANWVAPLSTFNSSGNLGAIYVIVIQPDGRLSGKNLRRPSGNPEFDLSVEQAIVRSNFPPLPPVFAGQADNPAIQFERSDLNRNG